ncbi:MAG TPA: hypothetical protein VF327_01220, partial [Gaiellaceae bacterium]
MSARETWPGKKPDDDELVGGYDDVTGDEVEPDEDEDEDTDETGGPDELGDDEEPDEPDELDGDEPELRLAGHAPGGLNVPDDVALLEGEPRGTRRGVGIVAAKFNGDVTNRLLESALAELDKAGVARETVT